MTIGKTIRIYLADGTPTGIRHAEMVNWTGQALVCPRLRLPELFGWDEARRPGVYFLFGDDDSGKPVAYVGEAEDVASRLTHHAANKEFWTVAVMVTSKDDNLTKAHVKYLEARCHDIGKAAGRVKLLNATTPTTPKLPRPDCDAMEDFLGPLKVLVGALGFRVLDALDKPPDPTSSVALSAEFLHMRVPKHGVDAAMALSDEGYVVQSGSTVSAKEKPSLSPALSDRRHDLVERGVLVGDGAALRLTTPQLFSSASAASSFVCGYTQSGSNWATESGVRLKNYEKALLNSVDDSPTNPETE